MTNEKTENRQAFLTIEMEPAEMAEFSEKAYRRLVKKVNIPGFRKGKAPRAILERHVGHEALFDDMVNEMAVWAYGKVVDEQALDALGRPEMEVEQRDPVVFKAVVPLRPVVTLGDYRQIRLAPEPVKVKEEAVDAVVERLRHQQATWEPVERPVVLGDLVTLDVESTIEAEPFINQQGVQYQVLSDSSAPVPGFAEQLVGLKAGEEKEFKLSFPEDYPRNEFAGKEVSFKVKVKEVKEEHLPEVTDEFASQVDAEIETVAALRDRIRSELHTQAEDRARRDFEDRVIAAAVDISQVEFPPLLVEDEVHRILDDQAQRLRMQGLTMEQYLRTIEKTEEELHEELKPTAERRVKESLVLGKISEEENIQVSAEEIDAEIADMVKDAPEERREELLRLFSRPDPRESIRRRLLSRKTIERVVEIARQPDEAASPQEKEEES